MGEFGSVRGLFSLIQPHITSAQLLPLLSKFRFNPLRRALGEGGVFLKERPTVFRRLSVFTQDVGVNCSEGLAEDD